MSEERESRKHTEHRESHAENRGSERAYRKPAGWEEGVYRKTDGRSRSNAGRGEDGRNIRHSGRIGRAGRKDHEVLKAHSAVVAAAAARERGGKKDAREAASDA